MNWRVHLFWLAPLLLCAVVVLPALVAAHAVPGLPDDKIQQAQVAYSKTPPKSSLSVSLQPPIGRVSASSPANAELVFTNTGDTPIENLSLSSPGCLSLDTGAVSAIRIEPRRSQHFSAKLSSTCAPGQYSAILNYSWREGNPVAEYRGFAATSPILVSSSLDDALTRFFNIEAGMLRNLLWPVLLFAAGAWVQLLMKKRDDRLSIVNTVLPDYSKLVQDHYLAINRRIDTVTVEADAFFRAADAQASGPHPTTAPSSARRVLCAILLMRARMLKLLNEKGGIYFVSGVGERLVYQTSITFAEVCLTVMGKDEFELGVNLLLPDDGMPVALAKCDGSLLFTGTLLPRFDAWSASHADAMKSHMNLLRILSAVLSFECNRPFYNKSGNWYVDPPTVELDAAAYEVPAAVKGVVHRSVRDWLNGIPPECRPGIVPPV